MQKIELYCGLSNDHIVKEPIILSCGHCVCKTCVTDQNVINCKICSKTTNNSELILDKESFSFKKMIRYYLSELFEDLDKRKAHGIFMLKSNI
jgi:hypothetical protein